MHIRIVEGILALELDLVSRDLTNNKKFTHLSCDNVQSTSAYTHRHSSSCCSCKNEYALLLTPTGDE